MKKWIYRGLLFVLIAIYIIYILNENSSRKNISIEIIISYLLIGIFSIKNILSDNRYYSLYKIHWYFIFIFMFIATLCQYLSEYSPWQYLVTEKTILVANYMILLWCFIFEFSYKWKVRFIFLRDNNSYNLVNNEKYNYADKNYTNIGLNMSSQIILFSFSAICFVVLVILIGFSNLTSIKSDNTISSSNWSILISLFLRSVPAITLSIFLFAQKQKQSIFKPFIVLLIFFTILSNFPASLSRYWVLPIYLGILLSFVPANKFKNNRFDICIIVGLCIIFPFMTLFKRMTLSQVLSGTEFDFSDIYNNTDFDAHSMLCRTIDYVSIYGYQMGKQLRSVIFFFVPRFIWNIKGIPSGELVATAQNSYYTNVSSPIMAEGYIDFGWCGIIIYAFLCARILKYFDLDYS